MEILNWLKIKHLRNTFIHLLAVRLMRRSIALLSLLVKYEVAEASRWFLVPLRPNEVHQLNVNKIRFLPS